MQYLNLDNLSKSFGEKTLFQNLSLVVNKGDKVALVAKNGSGKSSLVKILSNLDTPDSGQIYFANDIQVGILQQDPLLNKNQSVLENVLYASNPITKAIIRYEAALKDSNNQKKIEQAIAQMDATNAWDYEVKVKQVLQKLNIQELHSKVDLLSGGEKKRISLAKLLVTEPDFVVLDEPTNHLDLEMIEWIEEWLIQSNLTVLLITHDRYFLDRVCSKIVELDEGVLHSYSGSYTDYIIKKQERKENESASLDKAKNLYRAELDWMRRMPKARGTKSKARIDAFFELKKTASKLIKNDKLTFNIKPERLGSKIVELHNISKSFSNKLLFKNVNYKFKRFDKIGIIGPNGSGKTTFLNTLLGNIPTDTGKVVHGDTIKFGIFNQEGGHFNSQQRVIEAVQDVAQYLQLEGGKKLSASQLLEQFLFPSFMHYLRIEKLSGGEKRRLYLLCVLMDNPNFLILDEPTNDLDLMTLNVLENFLLTFLGCVLIVSHDRFFMDKIVNQVFVIQEDATFKFFPGNYSQYRLLSPPKKNNTTKKLKKTSPPIEGLSYEERKGFNKLEKEIEKLEQKKQDLEQDMLKEINHPVNLQKLSKQHAALALLIDEKTEKWLLLAERA